MESIDWGAVPAYFGGLALALTAMTIWRDHRRRDEEQAKRVAAWVERDLDAVTLNVRNASDLPIFMVSVSCTCSKGKADVQLSGERAQLAPGKSEVIDYKVGDYSVEQAPIVYFVDASGQKWHRGATGSLKRGRHRRR